MNKYEENSLTFIRAMSSEVDEKFKTDFLSVSRQVFGESSMMNTDIFNTQFIDNIYGESILVVVYSGDTPVGARSFWRNDIDGHKAYQPGSTAVIKEYRGRGIFKTMTNLALEKVEKDDLIYNFPNENSYPQYLKLGWKDYASYRKNIFINVNSYKAANPQIIDDGYLKWWIKPKGNLYVYYRNNEPFLVKKKRFNIYLIVGRINVEQASCFPLLLSKIPVLLYYYGSETFYNKKWRPTKVVIKYNNQKINIDIPFYKLDAL